MKKTCWLLISILFLASQISLFAGTEDQVGVVSLQGNVNLDDGTLLKGPFRLQEGELQISTSAGIMNIETSKIKSITGQAKLSDGTIFKGPMRVTAKGGLAVTTSAGKVTLSPDQLAQLPALEGGNAAKETENQATDQAKTPASTPAAAKAATPKETDSSFHFGISLDRNVSNDQSAWGFGDIRNWFNYYLQARDAYGNPMGASGGSVAGQAGWNLGLNMQMRSPEDIWRFTPSLNFYLADSPAMWITSLGYGSHSDLKMNYWSMGVDMAAQYGLLPGTLYAGLDAGLLLTFLSGHLVQSVNGTVPPVQDFSSFGAGFQMGLGVEWFFTSQFSLYAKEQFRWLGVDDALTYKDSTSSTGYSAYTMPNGKNAHADLSGSFMDLGLAFYF